MERENKFAWLPTRLNLLMAFLSSIPSLLLLLLLPPMFNSYDSFLFITQDLYCLVPHFPPLYPLWNRLVFDHCGQSDFSLYFLIVCQQSLYSSSVLYAANSFKNTAPRILFATIMASFIAGATTCHSVLTESLVLPAIVFAVGAIYRICRESKRLDWLVLFIALFIGMSARFSALIYVTLLPLCSLFKLIGTREVDMKRWKKLFVSSTALALLVFCSTKLFQRAVCEAVGSRDRNLIGRPGISLFEDIDWKSMSEKEKNDFVMKMKLRTKNPIIRKAIDIAAEKQGTGWLPIKRKLDDLVNNYNDRAPSASRVDLDGDDCLNQVAFILMTTIDSHTFNAFKNRLWEYHGRGDYVSTHLLYAERSCKQYEAFSTTDKYYRPFYANIRATNSGNYSFFQGARRNYLLKTYERMKPLYWLLIVAVLTGLSLILGRKTNLPLLASLVIVGTVRLIILSILTVHLTRYGIPSQLLIHLALAYGLVTLVFPEDSQVGLQLAR